MHALQKLVSGEFSRIKEVLGKRLRTVGSIDELLGSGITDFL